MKKIINITIFIIIIINKSVYGQAIETETPPCSNSIIRTDPNEMDEPLVDPKKNKEWPIMTNSFNWMDFSTIFTAPTLPPISGTNVINVHYPGYPGNYALMNNPFFTTHSYLSHLPNLSSNPGVVLNNQYLIDKMDITSKEHGWELVWKSNGYEMDNTTEITDFTYLKAPNFLLYNRYNGMLRWFTSLPPNLRGSFNTLNAQIDFVQANPNLPTTQYSGLFRNYKNVSKALDQPTEVTSISAPAYMSQNTYDFSVADFQMSYDPCQCLFPSMLKFSTLGITKADINAYGRLQGIATTKDFAVGNEIDNSKWLTSVWKDDNTGQLLSGMLQYKNVTDMNSRYQDIASGQSWNQIAKDRLDLIKNALEVGLIAAGDPEAGITSIEGLIKGTEDLSKINDFASLLFNSSQDNNTTTPMTIEGELALTGQVITPQQNSGFDFQVYNPGSYTTKSSPGNDRYLYPIYNEAMGLFALTKTIKTTSTTKQKSKDVDVFFNFDGTQRKTKISPSYVGDVSFRLNEPISYAMNPAANINNYKTVITAAWVIEIENRINGGIIGGGPNLNSSLSPLNSNFTINSNNLEKISKYQNSKNTETVVYMSKFLPLECIQEFVPRLTFDMTLNSYFVNDNFPNLNFAEATSKVIAAAYARGEVPTVTAKYLKINISYRFNDVNNQLLTSPQTFQTFKYEIEDLAPNETDMDLTQLVQSNIPKILNLGTTHYTTSQDIYAWDKIIISGNLTADPGVTINLKAMDGIEVNPESSISPEINLMIAPPYDCLPNKIMPSSIDCNDITKYKAGGLSKMTMETLQKNKETKEKTKTFSFVIFPNPAANMVQLQYSLSKSTIVNFSIYDVSGNLIARYTENNEINEGKHALNYNTEALSSGIYFCTLSTSDGYSETKKLIIAK